MNIYKYKSRVMNVNEDSLLLYLAKGSFRIPA